eukprot:TRINITY_DN247_c2_g3_i1.p1 TRINITY_DN247_c2_g3~~TRINITY_DN247_c2_g3_i1.p1  ORF type:complete len:252 (-),score=127.82 TRINITY_DN247_c2_g3_i1:53-808(-)
MKKLILIILLIISINYLNCIEIPQKNQLKILVTGFEPFANYSVNPSQLVAQNLNGKCESFSIFQQVYQLCWESWILSVDQIGSTKVANWLIANGSSWDAILHLGLEDYAKGLKLETVAANILATSNSSNPQPIQIFGLPILPITADLSRMHLEFIIASKFNLIYELLKQQFSSTKSAIEIWSRDAGTYYCNETLYRTLFAIRQQLSIHTQTGSLLPAMFVHLPNLQVIDLDTMTQLVDLIGQQLILPSIHC